MADQAILREYLVALGFKVDETAKKKFEGGLMGLDKKAVVLSKAVLGVAAAAQAMVATFAFQMEKLYYISKRTDGTVGNLQALAYGAGQVGIAGDQMKQSVVSFAAAIRSNPGLTGLLNSLGVQVTGRDKADVMMDFVAQIRKMPPYVAERYAALFGMDPDTLFSLSAGLEKLKEAQAIRKQMAADAGVDMEKAAEASMQYANALREVWERVGLLKDALAIQLLPTFMEFTRSLNENLSAVTRWLTKYKSVGEAISSLFDSSKNKRSGDAKSVFEWITSHKDPGAAKPMTEEEADLATNDAAHERLKKSSLRKKYESLMGRFGSKKYKEEFPIMSEAEADAATDVPAESKGSGKSVGATSNSAKLFAELEAKYKLPAGLLDRVWKKESNRGDPRYMQSHAGAKGHFQFMDPTAKQYGVQDPNDLNQSATGAAKYFADLLKQNDGDLRKASAAYNWGPGNLQRYGIGRAPKETRDYMDAVAGPAGATIQQETNIIVHGSGDPKAAAREVQAGQQEVNANMVRQLTPRVR